MQMCSVSIEQAEKNGDDSELKTAAVVSRFSLFDWNSHCSCSANCGLQSLKCALLCLNKILNHLIYLNNNIS